MTVAESCETRSSPDTITEPASPEPTHNRLSQCQAGVQLQMAAECHLHADAFDVCFESQTDGRHKK